MSFDFEMENVINLGKKERERETDSSQWHKIIYWENYIYMVEEIFQ